MARPLQLSLDAHTGTAALPKGMKPTVGWRAEEQKTRVLAVSTFPLPTMQIRQPSLYLVGRELLLTPSDLRRRRDGDFSQLDQYLSRETQKLHCHGQCVNLTPGPFCVLLRSRERHCFLQTLAFCPLLILAIHPCSVLLDI